MIQFTTDSHVSEPIFATKDYFT